MKSTTQEPGHVSRPELTLSARSRAGHWRRLLVILVGLLLVAATSQIVSWTLEKTTGRAAAVSGGNPLANAEWVDRQFRGELLETHQAGHYTYLRLRGEHETVWAVIAEPLPAGQHTLSLQLYAGLDSYRSPRLKKTFAPLYFAALGAEQ